MWKYFRLSVGQRIAHPPAIACFESDQIWRRKHDARTSALATTFLICLLLLIVGGCKQSTDDKRSGEVPTQASASPLPSSPARIHWLGLKQIAAETNSAGFMEIWNLPRSVELKTQVLNKLALAFVRTNLVPFTNHSVITDYAPMLKGASALLRPVLDDLLQAESYSELAPDPEKGQLVLAIKLDQARHRLWQSNLLDAIKTFTSEKPASQDANGWQIQLSTVPLFLSQLVRSVTPENSESAKRQALTLEIRRADDWTVIGLGQKSSALLQDFRSRITREHAPFPQRQTNFWFEAENLDCQRLLDIVGLKLPSKLPKLAITAIGDGTNVLTRGKLTFSEPLSLELQPWTIPTNLVSSPLVSFTAMRGFGKLVGSTKLWQDLQAGEPPNQLFNWTVQGLAAQTYFAAPHPDASNVVSKISQYILQHGASFFETNDVLKFERSETGGLVWKGHPAVYPFLIASLTNSVPFIFGGMFVYDSGSPAPAELLRQLTEGSTNLVYYDWELTGPRSDRWNEVGNFLRYGLYKEQLMPETPSRSFLVSTAPKLGNCGTVVTLTDSKTLSLSRRSTLGFTAIELQWLADWVESPNFPNGLHSFIPALPPIPTTGQSAPVGVGISTNR